ncbi:acylphosphatase [Candidatus Micrarchaeota archaeon CG10_big_fil_rev_8_21_14_0_10_45_29]|nr:MAG: acylphosphatase [Candidatus Micrarchaeota archaeon CG10_big_fil_rev_8_21_14_0_10_45_29]
MKCFKLRIFGNVQGVGFRALAQRIALSLSLTGWVKNEEGGSVLALVCGTNTAINSFIARISSFNSQNGARVERVQKLEIKEESGNSSPSFLIAP